MCSKSSIEAREPRQIYQSLLENPSTGVVVHNTDTSILLCNTMACSLLGLTEAEMIGKKAKDPGWCFLKEDFSPMQLEDYPVNRVIASGEDLSNLVAGVRHLDRFDPVWLLCNAFQKFNDQGELLHVVVTFTDISQLKKAEQEIKLQSEILENVSQGVLLVTPEDGRIIFCNPRFEKMFGYDPGELLGQDVAVVNAPIEEPAEVVARRIQSELKSVGTWKGITANIKKDGTVFWCSSSISTFHHPELGDVWVSATEDITDRKKLQDELDDHRRNLEQLVEERTSQLNQARLQAEAASQDLKFAQHLSHSGSWRLNHQTRELTWSNEVFRIIGQEEPGPKPLTDEAFMNLVHPDDRVAVEDAWTRSLTEQAPYSRVYRLCPEDGTTKYVKELAETRFDEDGSPLLSRGSIQDITEQVNQQLEIKRALHLLRTALEMVDCGYWEWDPETGETKWSERVYRIFGRDPTLPPVVYPDVQDYFSEASWEKLGKAIEQCLVDGKPYKVECEMRLPDGQQRWTISYGYRETGLTGNTTRLYGLVRDVTERKKLELAIERKIRAERASST